MICGRYDFPPSACFDEIDAAIRQMTDRVVAFNAHMFPAPKGAIIFNTENLEQVPDWRERWAGHELWDMGARNCEITGAKYVPIGYHPSMERFTRGPALDIDVVFCGSINERRAKIIDGMTARGLRVQVVGPNSAYGRERDEILARAKLALNMMFYPDGMFPALRVAHLVANRIPVLSERCPGGWDIVPTCEYSGLVDAAVRWIRDDEVLSICANDALKAFRERAMVLPS